MAEQQIKIHIPRNPTESKITIEVNGVKGSLCAKLTESIQSSLGTTISDEPTDEMNERPIEQEDHLTQ